MQWSQLKVEPGMRNQKPPAITNGRQLNFRLDRGLPTVVCPGGARGGVGGLCPRGVGDGRKIRLVWIVGGSGLGSGFQKDWSVEGPRDKISRWGVG